MNRLDRNARLLAVGFAAMAGMVDAIGFLASGGFFLSFMSGNSTRLSVGVVDAAPYVGMVAALLASFVIGVVAGSLIGRKSTFAHARRQAIILGIISLLLFAAPLIASFGFLLIGLCFAAFCMGLENTLFEREGSVSFGLTYMTGALVKIGQGLATMISGGPRLEWVPYLLLWLGLISGAAVGALIFGIFGYHSLWLPAAYAGIFALALLVQRNRFSG
ncbi:YoaK family protein [Sphingorhabdus sp. EL138]|uniref:YoaK family protein n=1 Tax=Sphingorhabdus sp. EL138 TaxID=2073156 RepID=UPI0025F8D9CA|nr:YoaK family protein [Sphingorhabdus sp. EL138]